MEGAIMILIFEQDTRERDGKHFCFKPMLFNGAWRSQRTWRIGWGLWTLSYYPEPGLKDFFDYVENTQWYKK
jgi:hypothetical protein